MIEMKGISKTYRVRRREAGLGNALKSLVSRDYTDIPALRDMSFTVPDGQILGYIGPIIVPSPAIGSALSIHLFFFTWRFFGSLLFIDLESGSIEISQRIYL